MNVNHVMLTDPLKEILTNNKIMLSLLVYSPTILLIPSGCLISLHVCKAHFPWTDRRRTS